MTECRVITECRPPHFVTVIGGQTIISPPSSEARHHPTMGDAMPERTHDGVRTEKDKPRRRVWGSSGAETPCEILQDL